jgi:hypothetical protein
VNVFLLLFFSSVGGDKGIGVPVGGPGNKSGLKVNIVASKLSNVRSHQYGTSINEIPGKN